MILDEWLLHHGAFYKKEKEKIFLLIYGWNSKYSVGFVICEAYGTHQFTFSISLLCC